MNVIGFDVWDLIVYYCNFAINNKSFEKMSGS